MSAVPPQDDRSPRSTGRDEEQVMTHYPNPALEAELAYRRELVARSFANGSRRGSWTGRRRRAL
jgi:hypothetical protein